MLRGSLAPTATGWFVANFVPNKDVHQWLSTTGSVLFYLTIPLIILAACCLDWMEKDKSQRQMMGARYDDEEDDEL